MNIFPFLSCLKELKLEKPEKLYTDACTYVALTWFVCNQSRGYKGKITGQFLLSGSKARFGRLLDGSEGTFVEMLESRLVNCGNCCDSRLIVTNRLRKCSSSVSYCVVSEKQKQNNGH